jgi:hypothetical protein
MGAADAQHAADEHAHPRKGAQVPLLRPWNIVSIGLHELMKGVWPLYLPLAHRVAAPQIYAMTKRTATSVPERLPLTSKLIIASIFSRKAAGT